MTEPQPPYDGGGGRKPTTTGRTSAFDWQAKPANESDRMDVLRLLRLQLRHSWSDASLRALCNALCKILRVAHASISLTDRKWTWMPASTAAPPGETDVLKVPRAMSVATVVLMSEKPEVLVTRDALEDPRGLCDDSARGLHADEAKLLCAMAELVVRHLEAPRIQLMQTQAQFPLKRQLKAFDSKVVVLDADTEDWPIVWANSPWCQHVGLEFKGEYCHMLWKLFSNAAASEGSDAAATFADSVVHQRQFSASMLMAKEDSSQKREVTMDFWPATSGRLDELALPVVLPDLGRTAPSPPRLRRIFIGMIVGEAGSPPRIKYEKKISELSDTCHNGPDHAKGPDNSGHAAADAPPREPPASVPEQPSGTPPRPSKGKACCTVS